MASNEWHNVLNLNVNARRNDHKINQEQIAQLRHCSIIEFGQSYSAIQSMHS